MNVQQPVVAAPRSNVTLWVLMGLLIVGNLVLGAAAAFLTLDQDPLEKEASAMQFASPLEYAQKIIDQVSENKETTSITEALVKESGMSKENGGIYESKKDKDSSPHLTGLKEDDPKNFSQEDEVLNRVLKPK